METPLAENLLTPGPDANPYWSDLLGCDVTPFYIHLEILKAFIRAQREAEEARKAEAPAPPGIPIETAPAGLSRR